MAKINIHTDGNILISNTINIIDLGLNLFEINDAEKNGIFYIDAALKDEFKLAVKNCGDPCKNIVETSKFLISKLNNNLVLISPKNEIQNIKYVDIIYKSGASTRIKINSIETILSSYNNNISNIVITMISGCSYCMPIYYFSYEWPADDVEVLTRCLGNNCYNIFINQYDDRIPIQIQIGDLYKTINVDNITICNPPSLDYTVYSASHKFTGTLPKCDIMQQNTQ